MHRAGWMFVVSVIFAWCGGWCRGDDSVAKKAEAAGKAAEADKQALAPLQIYVGEWRGVGQPRRGSTVGSWIEESQWAWKFEKGTAALVFATPKDKGAGKYFSAGRLERGEKEGQFRFLGTPPAESASGAKTPLVYTGSQDKDGRLVVSATAAPEGFPTRISLRTVAEGERLLMLYERRLGDTDNFTRLAEVGFTRKGGNFAKTVVERECVVTGGAGAIQVTHKGQMYWVCCTGCRDLFYDDPDGVLVEYRARKEAEKKKK